MPLLTAMFILKTEKANVCNKRTREIEVVNPCMPTTQSKL